jgi:prevent-host-death family protein
MAGSGGRAVCHAICRQFEIADGAKPRYRSYITTWEGFMRLGLREANQKFSKAIKAVKAGKEVVLTERGKPIAVIKPLERKENQEATIRRLEAEGLLRPALKRGPMPAPRWQPLRVKGKPLSQTISEERDER